MKKFFIIGTGTDVGKTYVAGLFLKKLKEYYKNVGYYKGALSGTNDGETDGEVVLRMAGIENVKISYTYKNSYSPHLAANTEGNPVSLDQIKRDFEEFTKDLDAVVAEGSGGIVCPIRDDKIETIMLEDIVKTINGKVFLVTESGLGAINSTVLTWEYCKNRGIEIQGIIMNRFDKDNIIHRDNEKQIEKITNVKVVGHVI